VITPSPSTDRVLVRIAQLVAASCAACVLVACSSSTPNDPKTSPSTRSPATSAAPAAASTTAPASKDDTVDAYCAATRAAGAAKAGTVGEDLAAVRAQATATRALSSLPDAPPGVEVFAKSADETAAVLEQFPAGDEVADVGLDPRFVAVAKKAAGDPGYREFITWTIQTCQLAPSGG
jgi:hypothetical protein